MKDNGAVCIARYCEVWRKDMKTAKRPWPALSVDLHPMINIRNTLSRQAYVRGRRFTFVAEIS